MKNSNLAKSLLWLAGTLIIGALGSGLWEIALKPGLYWLGNTLLNIGTLGLTSLRDAIYEEIARGSYERASERTYAMLVGIFVSIPLGIIVIAKISSKNEKRAEPRLLGLLGYQRALILFSVVFFTFLTVQTARLIYINRASNHVEQLQRIVSPYVSADQRLIYASRVAQMHSRQEYVDLMSELTEIAKKNNAHIPTFDIY